MSFSFITFLHVKFSLQGYDKVVFQLSSAWRFKPTELITGVEFGREIFFNISRGNIILKMKIFV